jgi:hypothetical protein
MLMGAHTVADFLLANDGHGGPLLNHQLVS